MANGDPQKEARLTAAACSLVHCADGVPNDAPEYAYLKALQGAGQGMTEERKLLGPQSGQDGRIGGPLYTYTTGMRFGDALTQNRVGTRLD